jgi:alkylhydroperoxidase family enzyme
VNTTLLPLIRDDAVPMEIVRQRYGRLLDLIRTLIGVVPNSFPYLEIWPIALRTLNVMVPNFLNLPISLWGLGAPRHIVGLAMYAASRAAGCAYCTAHCCSFALRRGTPPASLVGAVDGNVDASERAALTVARALSSVPTGVTDDERAELASHFPAAQSEWIVLAIAMMGFLNKFMDAVGVELEAGLMGEVNALIAPSGWHPGKHYAGPSLDTRPPRADNFGIKFGVLRYAPAAMSFDRKWTAGVPSRWPAVGDFLRSKTGHDFPVLSRLTHRRAIRAIATMVRDNFDAATSVIGLPLKARIGMVYAEVVGDAPLAGEVAHLSRRHSSYLDDAPARAALQLARAASSSPAQIDGGIVEACREARLGAAATIEIVAWLGVLQMLHRLSAFYAVGGIIGADVRPT